jgi:hypothetical protein
MRPEQFDELVRIMREQLQHGASTAVEAEKASKNDPFAGMLP